MESILVDVKFIVALLGLLGVALGYFYRSRKEKKEGLKKALYQLLELWHRMSALVKADFDAEFDFMLNELCRQVPEAKLTPEQMEVAKAHLTPILLRSVENLALSDYSSFEEQFNSALSVISKDDPIFAYKMRSVRRSRKFLKVFDDYLSQVMQPLQGDESDVANRLSRSMNLKAKEEAVRDLEGDIKAISWRIDIVSYIKVNLIICNRHRKLSHLHKGDSDHFLKKEIVPLIKEFNMSLEQTR